MPDEKFLGCKAIIFDLMGTCCDWKSGIIEAMHSLPISADLHADTYPDLAQNWRAGFFEEIQQRFEAGLPQEDIDVTHRRVLDNLLATKHPVFKWGDEERDMLVQAWHSQRGWPDVLPALQRLRERFFVVVLANGTTRLQLDIAKSSGLPFHMLFSSQLLGLTKPDPAIYRKAADLMDVKTEECIMVAAHAYDLRAAKDVGMRTAYVRRDTEDVGEDFEKIEKEVDVFVDGREGSETCGLGKLADLLSF